MDIYEQIWLEDQKGNGVRALRPDQANSADPASGYVIVNESRDGGANHQLFAEHAIPEQKRSTYDLAVRLFNNYALGQTQAELNLPEESAEVADLLCAVVASAPMKLARDFIQDRTRRTYDDAMWFKLLHRIWFRQYDQSSGQDLSGFEHVVVGEQQGGKVSGYHWWYKYLLDDSADFLGSDDITYSGARYGAHDQEGRQHPQVVTLSYRWNAFDYDANARRPLTKPTGGFWVGCSIEGLMAMGTVAFLGEAAAPRLAVIDGARYRVVCYSSSDRRSLRTFFPEFLGMVQESGEDLPALAPPSDGFIPGGTPGVVRIVAARVNPAGVDADRETVTLINTSNATVPLEHWTLAGDNNNRYALSEQIAAGEAQVVLLPAGAAQLSNQGGTITLRDAAGKRIHRVQYSRAQAQRQGWTIVF